MQVHHEHLARMRCVLRSATCRKAVGPEGREVEVLLNVPVVVSDFYTNGDLFDALFKPQQGGKLAHPRAMPEAIARHYLWQIVKVSTHTSAKPLQSLTRDAHAAQAVDCLHSQNHFHRDLKPENVMFDASYNIKARSLAVQDASRTHLTHTSRDFAGHGFRHVCFCAGDGCVAAPARVDGHPCRPI